MTSSRWPKNVVPPKGSSAFGEPIREDSPAERMTAASTWAGSARNALGGGFRAGLYVGLGFCRLRGVLPVFLLVLVVLADFFSVVLADDGLMRQVGGSAADGDQFRRDADGDLFGGERADFKTDRGIHAIKKLRREALAFERLIHGEHFARASDHAEIARVGFDGPGEHAHIVAVAAGDDHEVGGGMGL